MEPFGQPSNGGPSFPVEWEEDYSAQFLNLMAVLHSPL